ncbi:hypothetical protein U1Q18_004380 [Sarracenia purpurea var. burkii]
MEKIIASYYSFIGVGSWILIVGSLIHFGDDGDVDDDDNRNGCIYKRTSNSMCLCNSACTCVTISICKY